MYDGGGSGFAFSGERRTLTAGSASSVKRNGIGVRFWKEVSWPEGKADGSSVDLKFFETSSGGSIAC